MAERGRGRSAPSGGRGGRRRRGRPPETERIERAARDEAREALAAEPALPEAQDDVAVPGAAAERRQARAGSRELALPVGIAATLRSVAPALGARLLGPHVAQFARAHRQAGSPTPPDVGEFARQLWDPHISCWSATSATSKAALSGLDRKKLRTMTSEMGAALLAAEQHMQIDLQATCLSRVGLAASTSRYLAWGSREDPANSSRVLDFVRPDQPSMPEANIVASHGRVDLNLIAFVEVARYDEASSLIRVDQSDEAYGLEDAIPGGPDIDIRCLGNGGIAESVTAKVFQTEAAWGALVRRTDAHGADKYEIITSETASSAQILQATTAEGMAYGIASASCVRDRSVASFLFRMRLVASDRYAAQIAAEKGLAVLRGRQWSLLHLGCEVHMSTGGLKKALLIKDSTVTGMVRTVLALRVGGFMYKFRRCLAQEIMGSLVVKFGDAGEEAFLYRRAAVSTFMGVGRRRRTIQMILAVLPNGRWWLDDCVEVWVPAGSDPNRKKLSLLLARGLLLALASAQFRCWNRERWANNDESVGQLGLLEACHRLLRRTMLRFLVHVGHFKSVEEAYAADVPPPPAPPPAIADRDAGPGDHEQREDADDGADGRPADAGGSHAAASEDAPADPANLTTAAATSGDATNFAEQNSKNRRLSWRWLCLSPLRDMTIVRVVMEPNMVLLRKQFYVSSAAFDKDQRINNLPDAPSRDAMRAGRDFRILMAARGDFDDVFARHQRMLFNSSDIWRILTHPMRTEASKCEAFRMASRAGAEAERLMASRHRRPPFLLFLCLEQEQAVADMKALLAKSPCLLGKFSEEFMATFDVGSELGKAALRLIALLAWCDCVKLECIHAWVRRVIIRLGAQVRRPTFAQVAALLLVHSVRERDNVPGFNAAGRGVPTTDATTPASEEDEVAAATEPAAKAPRRGGGGGAQRAFNSRMLRTGQAKTFAERAALRRLRTPEEIAEDGRAGSAAAARHRHGERAFGPSVREMHQERLRKHAEAFNRRHKLSDDSFLQKPQGAIVPAMREQTDASFDEALAVARRAERLAGSEVRAAEQQLHQSLAIFSRETHPQIVGALIESFPTLVRFADFLAPMPFDKGLPAYSHIAFCPPVATLATDAIVHARGGMCAHRHHMLRPSLAELWRKNCEPRCEQKVPGFDFKNIQHECVCFLAGHCILHSDEGRRLRQFRNNVLVALKSWCPRKSPARDLLRDGFLVLRFRGRSQWIDLGGWGDDEDCDNEWSWRFLHVSLQVLIPWITCCQEMSCDEIFTNGFVMPDEDVALRATPCVGVNAWYCKSKRLASLVAGAGRPFGRRVLRHATATQLPFAFRLHLIRFRAMRSLFSVDSCKATRDFLVDYDAWATFDLSFMWYMKAYVLTASERAPFAAAWVVLLIQKGPSGFFGPASA